ncbi:MAG: hypothetical protein J6V82_02825 [Clostridia bacterium]|nr:hypothetical protein [Clostridia bacterium]
MEIEKKRNINAGHRGRMRQKLAGSGADGFLPHELLEMLLFHVMPRCDTNPIAHRLLDTFGSLEALFDAPVEAIAGVKGVGEKTAAFLKLCDSTAEYSIFSASEREITFRKVEELELYGASLVKDDPDPVLYLVLMDARNTVLDTLLLGHFPITSPRLQAKQIAAPALRMSATKAVLVGKRGGSIIPNAEELHCARSLSERLWKIGVDMMEYVIVCENRHVSCSKYSPELFSQKKAPSEFLEKSEELSE